MNRRIDAEISDKIMHNESSSSHGGTTIPFYSEDIRDAWKVVEFLAKQGIGLTIRPYVSIEEQRGTYRVAIETPLEVDYVTADSAPLGICLAALRAIKLTGEML